MSAWIINIFLFSLLLGCGGGTYSVEVVELDNEAPVASLTAQVVGKVGTASALSGIGSSDANGDTIGYSWRISSRPAGSTATLINSTSSVASLTPDVAGTYNIILTVSDGKSTGSGSMKLIALRNREMNELLVYYGWPSLINGSGGDTNLAVDEFKKYDYLFLGEGLEESSHAEHAKTSTIMADSDMSGTLIFGYVDLGVTTNNYPMSEIKTKIDNWKAMGANGIILDDYGYNYQTSRERQNEAVDYVHSVGLIVVANAYNPNDVFSSAVDATYNPDGLGHKLLATDYYLYESYQILNGNYINPSSDWVDKMNLIRGFQATTAFKVLGVTTDDDDVFEVAKFEYGYYSALLDGLAGYGRGDPAYAAVTTNAPYRTRPTVNPGDYTGAVTYEGWQDCGGGWCHLYSRTTENGTIYVKANDLFSYSFL